MFVQESPDVMLRKGAQEFIYRLAVLEQTDGRQAAYAKLGRQFPLIFGVHLGQNEVALELVHEFFKDRREHPTGIAPGRPEIHQDRTRPGAVQHDRRKVVGGDINNIRGIGHIQVGVS